MFEIEDRPNYSQKVRHQFAYLEVRNKGRQLRKEVTSISLFIPKESQGLEWRT